MLWIVRAQIGGVLYEYYCTLCLHYRIQISIHPTEQTLNPAVATRTAAGGSENRSKFRLHGNFNTKPKKDSAVRGMHHRLRTTRSYMFAGRQCPHSRFWEMSTRFQADQPARISRRSDPQYRQEVWTCAIWDSECRRKVNHGAFEDWTTLLLVVSVEGTSFEILQVAYSRRYAFGCM